MSLGVRQCALNQVSQSSCLAVIDIADMAFSVTKSTPVCCKSRRTIFRLAETELVDMAICGHLEYVGVLKISDRELDVFQQSTVSTWLADVAWSTLVCSRATAAIQMPSSNRLYPRRR